jgi:hypothetical protein
LGRNVLQRPTAQHGRQLLAGNGQVLAGGYPGIDHIGQPALLEGLHQPGQPTRLILDQLHHGIEQTIAALCVACCQRTDD